MNISDDISFRQSNVSDELREMMYQISRELEQHGISPFPTADGAQPEHMPGEEEEEEEDEYWS